MKISRRGNWVFYSNNPLALLSKRTGKWMYFFDNKAFVANICEKAIQNGIVSICKHSDDESGVACFYLSGDDIAGHRRVIQFFIDNNLIKRTNSGRYYNISFKYDSQTRLGQYGKNFNAEIKLENFLDLSTGKWK